MSVNKWWIIIVNRLHNVSFFSQKSLTPSNPPPQKNPPSIQQVKVLHSFNILYILIYRLTARLGISCRTEMLIQTWLVTTLFACFFVPFYQKDRTTCIFAKRALCKRENVHVFYIEVLVICSNRMIWWVDYTDKLYVDTLYTILE